VPATAGSSPLSLHDALPISVLEQLAAMYVVAFDARAVETYETLAVRAAASGLIDLEVKALVDMAYPLSWIDAERCLAVVDRALRSEEHTSELQSRFDLVCRL